MDRKERQELLLKHPFTLMLAGPTSSGKTQLVIRLLNDFRSTTTLKDKRRIRVLICYGVWQEAYRSISHPDIEVTFNEGFSYDYADLRPDVMVLDDLMSEMANDKKLTACFTKSSHHLQISVIYITQNVFHQSKEMRTISLNSHYILLMKSPRDKMQIMTLGKQIYPNNLSLFMQAYEAAVAQPYGHLLIDLTASTPEHLRLRQRKTVGNENGFEVYSWRET